MGMSVGRWSLFRDLFCLSKARSRAACQWQTLMTTRITINFVNREIRAIMIKAFGWEIRLSIQTVKCYWVDVKICFGEINQLASQAIYWSINWKKILKKLNYYKLRCKPCQVWALSLNNFRVPVAKAIWAVQPHKKVANECKLNNSSSSSSNNSNNNNSTTSSSSSNSRSLMMARMR